MDTFDFSYRASKSVCKSSDFLNVEYTPSLLLMTPITARFVGDPYHHIACENGFCCYFQNMVVVECDGREVFENRYYTAGDVDTFLTAIVCEHKDYAGVGSRSLSWRVGVAIGWLSALALTDRNLATYGLHAMETLFQIEEDQNYPFKR